MREIKFRVFDPSTKVMFVPDVISGDGRNWYATGRDYENGIDCNECQLMQFTGLKDKNGKDIYEGDIVKLVQAKRSYTVEFIDFSFKLIHADPKLDRMSWGPINRIKELDFDVEVIGNTYEHPELLKTL